MSAPTSAGSAFTCPGRRAHAGQVIALEPARDNLLLLRHNLRQKCDPERFALSPLRQVRGGAHAWLRLSRENAGDHRIGGQPGKPDTARIKMVALDDLVLPSGPVVMKMDVQGAESFVLDGAARILARERLRLITGVLAIRFVGLRRFAGGPCRQACTAFPTFLGAFFRNTRPARLHLLSSCGWRARACRRPPRCSPTWFACAPMTRRELRRWRAFTDLGLGESIKARKKVGGLRRSPQTSR